MKQNFNRQEWKTIYTALHINEAVLLRELNSTNQAERGIFDFDPVKAKEELREVQALKDKVYKEVGGG
jgi:hypothetical protein